MAGRGSVRPSSTAQRPSFQLACSASLRRCIRRHAHTRAGPNCDTIRTEDDMNRKVGESQAMHWFLACGGGGRLCAPLPPHWTEHLDPDKGVYYFNANTGESAWGALRSVCPATAAAGARCHCSELTVGVCRSLARAPHGRLLPQAVQVSAQEQGGDAGLEPGAIPVPAVAGRPEGANPSPPSMTIDEFMIRD
jgi:hypothetical protein